MQGADQASDLHTAPRQPSRQWTQAGLLGKVKSISPPQRASPSPASTTTKYAPRQKAASEWKPEPSFIPPARKMGLGKQVPGLSPVRTGWKSQQGLCDPMSAPSNKIGDRSQDQTFVFWEYDYFYIVCVSDTHSLSIPSHFW